ncbi:MAG TPA: hypothetical protein VN048_09425 [Verrucomicrobiae bacterium]|nr:hypothetical protein [Verrucomicrobiae bacterium]
MRTLLLLFGLLPFATSAGAQTFKIAHETFHPALTNLSSAGYIKEYLPAGQTSADWTKSFGVSVLKKAVPPRSYISNLCKSYHRQYPEMKYASGGQESRNRWFADFLVYPKTPASKYLEWNFFRAQTNSAGGIIVFQYTERRTFKKSIQELDSWDVPALRKQLLPFLMTNEFVIK